MSAWKAGKVHWWDESKGKGFIVDSDDGELYVVHYSTIDSDKRKKNLKVNQKVKFKIYENAYSAKVEKVKPLNN